MADGSGDQCLPLRSPKAMTRASKTATGSICRNYSAGRGRIQNALVIYQGCREPQAGVQGLFERVVLPAVGIVDIRELASLNQVHECLTPFRLQRLNEDYLTIVAGAQRIALHSGLHDLLPAGFDDARRKARARQWQPSTGVASVEDQMNRHILADHGMASGRPGIERPQHPVQVF
ncbi:hypothetical protein [Stenotrophomonas maltophilia]|uniref:hypothetical protein n=1 Tax=Stenotrophomonas maltophilia TaxID=40324 RepID=UPI00351DC2BC